MEITPSSSFFDMQERPASPKKMTTTNPFDSDEDVGLREVCLEEEGKTKNTNTNPFQGSYTGEIDGHKALEVSRPNSMMSFKQELEETVTLRTEASSSGSESGSAGSEDNSSNSGDDSDSDGGHPLAPPEVEEEPTGLLEVEVEEIAHEQEEYNLEDELQDEPLDDESAPSEELGEPIRNSVGITIGFKKIKRIAKAAKRLGKSKGKSKRESISETNDEVNENAKVVQELQSLLHEPPAQVPQKSQTVATTTGRTVPAAAPPMKEVVPNQFSNIVLTSVVADIGMAAAEAAAVANGWDVTICICDTTGIPLQVKRSTNMRGSAASYDMAVQKAKMAATFAQVTGQGNLSNPVPPGEEEPIDATQTALVALYPFLHIGGGYPLVLNGTCCGAVGVSNGQVNVCDQQQDQHVAKAAVKAMADIYWNYQVLATNEV